MCFKEMNRHFTIEDIQMSNKPIKILSTSLAMSKMLVQTTMRFHYTPIRTAKIISDITKCCQDVKLNHLCCWEVCKVTQPLGKKQEKQTYHSTPKSQALGHLFWGTEHHMFKQKCVYKQKLQLYL